MRVKIFPHLCEHRFEEKNTPALLHLSEIEKTNSIVEQ